MVIDVLVESRAIVLGFVDDDTEKKEVDGFRRLGSIDYIVSAYGREDIWLVNGMGSIGAPGRRRTFYMRFKASGYAFASVVHSASIVSPNAELEEGVQVMAGAIIQPGAYVGENTIVNTGATVDHDCTIGSHVHIAPGAILSGNVQVGDRVHIGTGATIIQGVEIGNDSVVGAGSVVIKNVKQGEVVFGVPARPKPGDL